MKSRKRDTVPALLTPWMAQDCSGRVKPCLPAGAALKRSYDLRDRSMCACADRRAAALAWVRGQTPLSTAVRVWTDTAVQDLTQLRLHQQMLALRVRR
jgi:hypothetical protein